MYEEVPVELQDLTTHADMRADYDEKDDYKDAYEKNYKRYISLFCRSLSLAGEDQLTAEADIGDVVTELESKFVMSQSTLDNFKCG